MNAGASTPAGVPLRSAYEFQCTPVECAEALRFHNSRFLRRWRRGTVAIVLGLVNFAAALIFGYFAARLIVRDESGSARGFALSLAVLIAAGIASRLSMQHSLIRFAATDLGSRRALVFADDGLRCGTASGGVFIAWNGIRFIEEVGSQILVYQNDLSFVQIPASAFADTVERSAFLALLRSRAGVSERQPIPVPNLEAPRLATRNWTAVNFERGWANFICSMRQGFRLAFFQQPTADPQHAPLPSWSLLVALVFAAVLPAFAVGLLQWGGKASFSPSALPGVLFGLPVLTVGAWALARVAGRTDETLRLLTAFVSLALPIDLTTAIIDAKAEGWLAGSALRWSDGRLLPAWIAAAWLALAALVAAIRLLGMARSRWLVATLLSVAVVGLPLGTIYRERTLWYPPFDEKSAADFERSAVLRNEDVFYLQPRLLEQQLAALQRGRRGIVDLYFIGVAGYASQDVFMNEVRSVTRLFDERFDTKGRSLMLINNPATVRETPIASPTSLRLALNRVGEVMDRNEDVLFLFITSHGSKEHETSFDFSPLRFNRLDPQRLKEMLDQSGIQRRVVVVSTCYSGAFVEALKDDRTLVISASSTDRNSFGCTNDADFTYFGKAYFDEALRKTYSFTEAFDMAREAIAERERNANYPGSQPMMFAGDAIRRRLEEFVRLRQATAPRSTSAALAR
jgi:hypothetical protein